MVEDTDIDTLLITAPKTATNPSPLFVDILRLVKNLKKQTRDKIVPPIGEGIYTLNNFWQQTYRWSQVCMWKFRFTIKTIWPQRFHVIRVVWLDGRTSHFFLLLHSSRRRAKERASAFYGVLIYTLICVENLLINVVKSGGCNIFPSLSQRLRVQCTLRGCFLRRWKSVQGRFKSPDWLLLDPLEISEAGSDLKITWEG